MKDERVSRKESEYQGEEKSHHGVAFERCGRNLIEDINTSDNGSGFSGLLAKSAR
jgi:hypothetical protein